jgi:predicted MPP superfamily phosphohydrolase
MLQNVASLGPLNQSALRWLHITDLHVGHTNESQRTALRSLLTSIDQFSNGIPFDLVVFTGDLAFSGQREQYEALNSQLIHPLKSNSLCSRARFFAVPGNHDLDCSTGYPPVWKELGHTRQESFFHLDESGGRIRSARAQGFKEYQDFVRGAGIESVDPTTAPAVLIRIPRKPRPLAIILAVTAFFSDKEVSDRQKAPAPVHPIRTFLQDLPEDTQTIILGHHPLEWYAGYRGAPSLASCGP